MSTLTRHLPLLLLFVALPIVAADELVARIQKDLVALGYDPGTISGELVTETTVAIGRYQALRAMEVTGRASPELARTLAADVARQRGGSTAGRPATSPAPAGDSESLRATQRECLQEKVSQAQEAQKKKRGFGRLLGAVGRIAGRSANYDLQRTIGDVYSANATAADLSAAARDLGLTEDQVAQCQNPSASSLD